MPAERLDHVVVALIDDDPDNRAVDVERIPGLAALLARDGLRDPLEIYPSGAGRFTVSAGHHRLAAVRSLGWVTVPARVVATPASDLERHARRCSSNWARVETRPADDAQELARLVAAGASIETLCEISSRNSLWVRNRLELAKVDPGCRWIAERHGINWAIGLAGLPGHVQRALGRALEETRPSRARWEALLERSRQRQRELEYEDAARPFELVGETWDADHGRYVAELGADDPAPAPAPGAPGPVVREIPLGLSTVAAGFSVAVDTVQKWRNRSRTFPDPDLWVSGIPLWWRETVTGFAERTGRTFLDV